MLCRWQTVLALLVARCAAQDFLRHSAESLRKGVLARVRCGGQGVDEQACRKCLERTFPAEYGAVRASYVLLDRLSSLRKSSSCEEEQEACEEQRCKERLLGGGGGDVETLERTLREVRAVFRPDPDRPCFSAEMVLNEVDSRSEALASLPREDATVLLLIGHLYSGECIDVGESVADFLDDIFLHYGDGCERVMTQSGFAQLWNDLQMQRKGRHVDHDVRNACDASTPLVVLRPESGGDSDVYVLGGGDHGREENGTASKRRRGVRHTPEDHEHKNLANECLESDALLHRFLSPDNQKITSSEFLQLCPALVQQAVSGVCSDSAHPRHPTPRNDTVALMPSPEGASPWSAVVSVSGITAVSLLGLFLLPVLKRSFFVYVNAFFTGLAFGTMSGDVVLHIMPQYLGLHRHDDEGHAHPPSEEEGSGPPPLEFPAHLQRQLAFLLTMYLLFLFECIFTAFATQGKESHHGHSHGGAVEIALRDLASVPDIENGEAKVPRCARIVEFLRPSNLFSGMSSKAAVIVLADTVHNFADGMAIAVGFSTSYKDGFSTSVAVFFHELPHEIGDFVVLMNCGLGFWKAFVFNVLSGLSAFLGLGVGVFAAPLFREWLLCVTAGLFFFVVMVEMLPDMRLESKEKWPEFAVKVTGTVCGISTMIVIAVYELSVT